MKYKIGVITASKRPVRMAGVVTDWVKQEAGRYNGELEFTFIDLTDWDLPHYNEVTPAMFQKYGQEEVKRWAATIADCDGFVFIVPEYNHSFPGAFKDAIDYLYHEWAYKPVAFIAYGLSGAYRVVEHLQNVTVAVGMAPLHTQINIPIFDETENGTFVAADRYHDRIQKLFTQLGWWTSALAEQRRKQPIKL